MDEYTFFQTRQGCDVVARVPAQVVERAGQPVALLVGGPACDALKERDHWLSWSAPQRRERLKLLVQNRRFLLLPLKGSAPNLASQCLAAAVRTLPGQWRQHFGDRPLPRPPHPILNSK